jgi:hypothetical protein
VFRQVPELPYRVGHVPRLGEGPYRPCLGDVQLDQLVGPSF